MPSATACVIATVTSVAETAPGRGRSTEILTVARDLLEDRGWDSVTMRGIAERMGIRAPSLYKHVAGKDEMRTALVAVGFVETAEAFRAAIDANPDEPLAALGRAYRSWALAHPHLYVLMHDGPLDRDALPDGVEDAAAAPLVEACGGDGDVARAVWAFAHGMTSLELAGRFPPGADLDTAWSSGIAAFGPRPDRGES